MQSTYWNTIFFTYFLAFFTIDTYMHVCVSIVPSVNLWKNFTHALNSWCIAQKMKFHFCAVMSYCKWKHHNPLQSKKIAKNMRIMCVYYECFQICWYWWWDIYYIIVDLEQGSGVSFDQVFLFLGCIRETTSSGMYVSELHL